MQHARNDAARDGRERQHEKSKEGGEEEATDGAKEEYGEAKEKQEEVGHTRGMTKRMRSKNARAGMGQNPVGLRRRQTPA